MYLFYFVSLFYSNLKITKVKDLPDKFKCKTILLNQDISSHEPRSQRKVEETAATPPVYKYATSKFISLDESLKIQEKQKLKVEVCMIKKFCFIMS